MPSPTPTTVTDRIRETLRNPRRLAVVIVVLVVVALAVATLGSGRQVGTIMSGTGRAWDWQPEQDPVDVSDQQPPPDEDTPAPLPLEEDNGSGGWVVAVLVGLAAIALIVLVVLVVRRVRQLSPDVPDETPDAPDEDLLTVEEAQDALTTALDRVDYAPTPNDAVVDSWLALEHAVGEAGIHRRETQTTAEYVIGVLSRLDLPARDLETLAELYRRALFDRTELTEAERDRARSALHRLSGAVGTTHEPPAAPVRHVPEQGDEN
jgi:hypothetical protein